MSIIRWKNKFRRWLWSMGCDIYNISGHSYIFAYRWKLFQHLRINLVVDVGAHHGKYGKEIREILGYKDRIISFEPVRASFEQLCNNSANDSKWMCSQVDIGDQSGTLTMFVSRNSFSSSLLPVLKRHQDAAPDSVVVNTETVEVTTLDSVLSQHMRQGDRVHLKIDTQGYENRVIAGAVQSLRSISSVQLEASLTPLYSGEAGMSELCALLNAQGFLLTMVEPGYADQKTGELLQVELFFQRGGESNSHIHTPASILA